VALAAITVSAAEIPAAEPESVGMSSERLLRIDATMQRQIDAGHIQGAVTAVARRGKLVHFNTHGLMDVEAERPMTPDALFIMMSSTKPVLGVAAMMVIEEGLIRPTDPVSKYIPEFADMQVAVLKEPADEDIIPRRVDWQNIPEHRLIPAETAITIEHLLTHTSGLGSGGLGSAAAFAQNAQRDTLAGYIPKLGDVPLDFHPGTRWAYSGAHGLDVVARIIEIVSGTPFQDFVQTRIFDPLDMKDTHWIVPEDKRDRMPVFPDDKGPWIKSPDYFSGSIGLVSTARDYMHFEQMLVNNGTLFGHQLLKPESVTMMSTNQVGNLYNETEKGGSGRGFGYTVGITIDPDQANDGRTAGAFGWMGAAGTVSWTAPEDELTVVYMVQGPTDLPWKIAEIVTDAILD
jgi:CubicO group peptidase (beta-lactamase class C family)